MKFDLLIPENAYLFGFLQTDGHLAKSSRNRGKISIELAYKDIDILYKIQNLLPEMYSSIKERTRDTNFKKDYHSAVLTICDQNIRETLNKLGLPYGKKSKLVLPPTVLFSINDYFRGLIDGDGSLGFTLKGKGFPFLSFCTSSKLMCESYLKFIFDLTGKLKIVNPNKRDKNYNICVYKEDAQIIAKELYYENCLGLNRKIKIAKNINGWIRPITMKKSSKLC